MMKNYALLLTIIIFCAVVFPVNAVSQQDRGTGLWNPLDFTSSYDRLGNNLQDKEKLSSKSILSEDDFTDAFDQGSTQSCVIQTLFQYLTYCFSKNMGKDPNKFKLHPYSFYWFLEQSQLGLDECSQAQNLSIVTHALLDMSFPLFVDECNCGQTPDNDFIEGYKANGLDLHDIKTRFTRDGIDFNTRRKVIELVKEVIDKKGFPAIWEMYPIEGFKKIPSYSQPAIFKSADTPENNRLSHSLGKNEIGHMLLIVGYTDDISTIRPTSTKDKIVKGLTSFKDWVIGEGEKNYPNGAFKVLNSWGTEWGNNGYVWIPYDEFFKWTLSVLEIDDSDDIEFTSEPVTKFNSINYDQIKDHYYRNSSRGILDVPEIFLLSISDELEDFSLTKNKKLKRAESRFYDRLGVELMIETYAKETGYGFRPPKIFIGDEAHPDSIKAYVRNIKPDENDVVIVYYRGIGIEGSTGKQVAMRLQGGGVLNGYDFIEKELEDNGAGLNLLLTDFSSSYRRKTKNQKRKVLDDFKLDRTLLYRERITAERFFTQNKGTYWISSQKSSIDDNYAVARLGSYFRISLTDMITKSGDIYDFIDNIYDKNRSLTNFVLLKENQPTPVLMYPERTKDPSFTNNLEVDTIEIAMNDSLQKVIMQSQLEELLRLEPVISDRTTFKGRVHRIEQIKKALRKWTIPNTKIIVQENAKVFTEFILEEYLERIKSGTITDIKVIDLNFNEESKIDQIKIKEQVVNVGLGSLKSDIEIDTSDLGIALRAFKEVHLIYNCVGVVINDLSTNDFRSWSKEMLKNIFENGKSKIAVCNHNACVNIQGKVDCSFTINRYTKDVLKKSSEVYSKFKIGLVNPSLETKPTIDNGKLEFKFSVIQPYEGTKNKSQTTYSDRYKKTFHLTAMSEVINNTLVIKNVRVKEVTANCNPSK